MPIPPGLENGHPKWAFLPMLLFLQGLRVSIIQRKTGGAKKSPYPAPSTKRRNPMGQQQQTTMSAASHRFIVGDIECTAVADGTMDYAADALFVNVPKESAEQVVREHGLQPEEIPLSFTGLVIDTGRQRVLVDTGLGAGVVPSAGG